MDTVITRSRWVLGFFIFALSICAVRLVQLQIIEGPSLAAQGQRVRTSSTEVAAARGTITDATGGGRAEMPTLTRLWLAPFWVLSSDMALFLRNMLTD